MIMKIRSALHVETVDATALTTEARYEELRRIAEQRKQVTEACKNLTLQSPQARYDLEYSTASELARLTGVGSRFKGTHYWFWSPVLDQGFLSPILCGYKRQHNGHAPRVMEVGAGNGALLRQINRLGVGSRLLHSIDISPMAIQRTNEMGVSSLQGTLASNREVIGSVPMVFLSYFVDRDSDQRATFRESSRICCHTLVLEGLFPCVLSDSSGVSYGRANVTRGEDALEDIQLVVGELTGLGMSLKKVVVGQRLVYSLDGPEVLPSYILVFKARPSRGWGSH